MPTIQKKYIYTFSFATGDKNLIKRLLKRNIFMPQIYIKISHGFPLLFTAPQNCNAGSSNISSNSNSNDNMANTNKYGYYNYKNNNRGRNHETNGEPNEPTNNNAGNNKDNEEDVVDSGNNLDHNDVDNMSSEQQPDIIPYPPSVGESSWKAEKLRQQHHWQQNT